MNTIYTPYTTRRTYYRSYSSRHRDEEALAVVAIVALYILTFIILSLGAVLSSPVIAIRSEKEQRGENVLKWIKSPFKLMFTGGAKISIDDLELTHDIFVTIQNIILDILEKIPQNNIDIRNICINGKNINGLIKHVKCKKNDYNKNISIIKKIFKKIDFTLENLNDDEITDIKKIQNKVNLTNEDTYNEDESII